MRLASLVVLTSVLVAATPAHAGRYDQLRQLVKRGAKQLGALRGRVPGEQREIGIGPEHSFDTRELRSSTLHMTSPQFKFNKSGKLVAARALFESLRPRAAARTPSDALPAMVITLKDLHLGGALAFAQ